MFGVQLNTGSEGWIGWNPSTAQPNQGAPGSKLLVINSTNAVSHVSQTTYTLEYSFKAGHDDCLADFPYGESRTTRRRPVAFFEDIIVFNISNITGVMPETFFLLSCPSEPMPLLDGDGQKCRPTANFQTVPRGLGSGGFRTGDSEAWVSKSKSVEYISY